MENHDEKNENQVEKKNIIEGFYNTMSDSRSIIYSIFHTIIALFALYISWRCNNGFNLPSVLVACCCPYIYIVYALVTRGGCFGPVEESI